MSLFCWGAQNGLSCHYEFLQLNLFNTLVGLWHGLKGLSSWDVIHVQTEMLSSLLTFRCMFSVPWPSHSYGTCAKHLLLGLVRLQRLRRGMLYFEHGQQMTESSSVLKMDWASLQSLCEQINTVSCNCSIICQVDKGLWSGIEVCGNQIWLSLWGPSQ